MELYLNEFTFLGCTQDVCASGRGLNSVVRAVVQLRWNCATIRDADERSPSDVSALWVLHHPGLKK